jgi:catechol 2,3-dioxygenase-like lactoylglutathione lyase family enzyme
MSQPVPAIDHAVVNVLDRLDATADQYQRLGFRLTARGHHSLGSSNHLAVFETDYLELLGYEPGSETKRADVWRHPPGLTGLVFKVSDPDALYAGLRARGVPVEPPLEFRRPVALAEGARDARFRVIRVAPELIENGRTFFCHHFTPELVWRREWQDHPNGVTGIAEFVIAARDPTRTANVYDRMFGPNVLEPVAGGVAFRAGQARVSILDAAAITHRFGAAATLSADGSDRMVALALSTRSLDSVRRCLDRGGISYAPVPGGGIVVAAPSAAGVALTFLP